jgi:hypothetical protein
MSALRTRLWMTADARRPPLSFGDQCIAPVLQLLGRAQSFRSFVDSILGLQVWPTSFTPLSMLVP